MTALAVVTMGGGGGGGVEGLAAVVAEPELLSLVVVLVVVVVLLSLSLTVGVIGGDWELVRGVRVVNINMEMILKITVKVSVVCRFVVISRYVFNTVK